MFLFVGIDVDHHIPDVREACEDEPLDFGGDGVRLPHRHLGIHVQLQIDDQILAGPPAPDLMNVLDPGDVLYGGGDVGDEPLRRLTVHQIVGCVPEGFSTDVEYEKRGKSRGQGVHQPDPEVCTRDADQCGHGGEGILAVILGDGVHGRAPEFFRHRKGIAAEPLFDNDGGRGGQHGDQLRLDSRPLAGWLLTDR